MKKLLSILLTLATLLASHGESRGEGELLGGYAIDSPIVKGIVERYGIIGEVRNGVAILDPSTLSPNLNNRALLCISGYDQNGNWWVRSLEESIYAFPPFTFDKGFDGLCTYLKKEHLKRIKEENKHLLFAPGFAVEAELIHLEINPKLAEKLLKKAGLDLDSYKLIDPNTSLKEAEKRVANLAKRLKVKYRRQWEWRARIVHNLLKAQLELNLDSYPLNLYHLPEVVIFNAKRTKKRAKTPKGPTITLVEVSEICTKERKLPARIFGDYAVAFEGPPKESPTIYLAVKQKDGKYLIVGRSLLQINRVIGQVYQLYQSWSDIEGSCILKTKKGEKVLGISSVKAVNCKMKKKGKIVCTVSAGVIEIPKDILIEHEEEQKNFPLCPKAVVEAYKKKKEISAEGELFLTRFLKKTILSPEIDFVEDPIKRLKKRLKEFFSE